MPRKKAPGAQKTIKAEATAEGQRNSQKKRDLENSRFESAVAQQVHETTGYNTGINWLRPPSKKSASDNEEGDADDDLDAEKLASNLTEAMLDVPSYKPRCKAPGRSSAGQDDSDAGEDDSDSDEDKSDLQERDEPKSLATPFKTPQKLRARSKVYGTDDDSGEEDEPTALITPSKPRRAYATDNDSGKKDMPEPTTTQTSKPRGIPSQRSIIAPSERKRKRPDDLKLTPKGDNETEDEEEL
ncbi:MAG: hypothetical protein Q9174_004838, partial [Haloplaca sp. 1 TL-2023]